VLEPSLCMSMDILWNLWCFFIKPRLLNPSEVGENLVADSDDVDYADHLDALPEFVALNLFFNRLDLFLIRTSELSKVSVVRLNLSREVGNCFQHYLCVAIHGTPFFS